MAKIKGLSEELKRIANLPKGSGDNEHGDGGISIPPPLRFTIHTTIYQSRALADSKNGKSIPSFVILHD